MRLTNVLPEFASELERLLLAANHPELAAQIPELEIARRCSCEDDFCATFHTKYVPGTSPKQYPPCISLEPKEGMITLDISSGRIIGIEVLFREDVRKKLRALFP
jgi:hypothetical protein